MLTSLFKRETFLAALFLWKIPFEAALSITDVAFLRAATAASLSFAATAASTFYATITKSGGTPDVVTFYLTTGSAAG